MRSGYRIGLIASATLALAACNSGGGSGDDVTGPNSACTGSGWCIGGSLAATTVTQNVQGIRAVEKVVSHVIAVDVSTSTPQRVVSEVAADGSFSLVPEGSGPWALVFADSTQTGSDMIVGILKMESLDSLPPVAEEGELDLEEVEVDGEQAATTSVPYTDVLATLGITEETAAYFGAMDDAILRYVNPDVDGDGVIDLEQLDHNYGLDFHVHYSMELTGSGMSTAEDLVSSTPEHDWSVVAAVHQGAGIYVYAAESVLTGDASSSWARFEDDVVVSVQGDTPSDVEVAAGTQITSDSITTANFSGYTQFGVYVNAGNELPQGRYEFGRGETELAFTHVQTHTAAQFASAENRILPFLWFVPVVEDCTSECEIDHVAYAWMKNTEAGWVEATLEEIHLVAQESGAYISIAAHGAGDGFGASLPSDSATGTIPWDSTTTSADICNPGISYDDKLGMRLFTAYNGSSGC